MTSAEFYSKSGRLLGHVVVVTGEFPGRSITVVFRYERGESTHDGKTWTYSLN